MTEDEELIKLAEQVKDEKTVRVTIAQLRAEIQAKLEIKKRKVISP
ncbi:hypothetical protein [Clostridium sp.]